MIPKKTMMHIMRSEKGSRIVYCYLYRRKRLRVTIPKPMMRCAWLY